jgi:hypothetical protein
MYCLSLSRDTATKLHGTGWPVTLSPTMVRTYGSTHAPISLLNSYREPRWLWSISAMLARPTKPDSTKYKLSTASKLKPAGFEFRMFDHFPSAVAHELVATVVTLSALTYTKSNLSKVMDVQTHRECYNKWVCLHCMEVEDRLTQRIGLVSGKRWAHR